MAALRPLLASLSSVLLALAVGCAAPTVELREATITIDARGVESGKAVEVLCLLVNDPTLVPEEWRASPGGGEGTTPLVLDRWVDPAGEVRRARRSFAGDGAAPPPRVASVSFRVAPRARRTVTLDTYSDCLDLFVAARAVGAEEGAVFGPFRAAAFADRTVRLSGRRGEYAAAAGAR